MDDKPALNELPALLAEELARIDGLNPVTRDIIRGILDDAVDRAEEAEARVAELQAALAAERDAHAWRPVTDDAPAPLEKVVVATRDDPDVAWRLPEVPHLWNTRRGRSLLTQEIAGYLPLPPQEPQ